MPKQQLGQRTMAQDVRNIRTWIPQLVRRTTPLTNANFNGDSFSTTAKTLVDLSADFGLPAGARAIITTVLVRDSDSSGTACWMILAPNDTAGQGARFYPSDIDDRYGAGGSHVITLTDDGDIYYQINASGAGTFDVYWEIWGYWL